MKHICLVFFSVLLVHSGYSQEIRPMKATELIAFIAASDRPLVVTFWTTYCKPCVEEIPYFQSFIADRYTGLVDLLLVSLDPKEYYPRQVTSFASNKKFTAPIIWLNENNAHYYCPLIHPKWTGTIPATLMINNKNSVRKFYQQQLTPRQFERELKSLLEE